MENTSRAWVWVAVGFCGVLSAGILLKRSGGGESDKAQQAERLAKAIAEKSNTSDGWRGSEAGSGAGADKKQGGSGHSSSAGGAGSVGGESGSAGASALLDASGRRITGGRIGRDGSVSGGGLVADGSGAGSAAERLARQSREARARMGQASRDVAPVDPLAPNQAAEADQPVFSAFKDGKLEVSDDNGPLAADNVQSEDGHVQFEKDSKYVVPDAANISGPSGSIAFWVKPEWEGAEAADAHMVDLSTPNIWENRLAVNKNGRYLRFMFFPNTGQEVGVSSIIDNWQPQQEHHVVATWGPQEDGGNVLEFYVDGRLVGTDHYDGEFEVPQTQPMIIGNNRSGELGTRGGIRGFEIYPNRIDGSKVGSIYNNPQP